MVVRRRRDPVTPELWRTVVERDGGCVARILEPDHVCRDRWGMPPTGEERGKALAGWASSVLTLDHVHDGYGCMGRRAPSNPGHLVTLCWGAHLGGWATSHRPLLRGYLARANGKEEVA